MGRRVSVRTNCCDGLEERKGCWRLKCPREMAVLSAYNVEGCPETLTHLARMCWGVNLRWRDVCKATDVLSQGAYGIMTQLFNFHNGFEPQCRKGCSIHTRALRVAFILEVFLQARRRFSVREGDVTESCKRGVLSKIDTRRCEWDGRAELLR